MRKLTATTVPLKYPGKPTKKSKNVGPQTQNHLFFCKKRHHLLRFPMQVCVRDGCSARSSPSPSILAGVAPNMVPIPRQCPGQAKKKNISGLRVSCLRPAINALFFCYYISYYISLGGMETSPVPSARPPAGGEAFSGRPAVSDCQRPPWATQPVPHATHKRSGWSGWAWAVMSICISPGGGSVGVVARNRKENIYSGFWRLPLN